MRKIDRGFTVVELFTVLIVVSAIGGWVANIVKLAHMDFSGISGMLVLRAFGIVIAPLGSVLGFV